MSKKYLVAIAIVVVAVVGFLVGSSGKNSFGGLIEQRAVNFVNGIRIGNSETTVIDGSGNFTIPGTFSANGGDARIGTLVQSGGVDSLSSGSWHYTAIELCDNSLIRHTIHGATAASASNFTLPTAAALIADCVPSAGDTKMITVENTSNDAGEILTFVAGAGIDLGVASSSQATPGTQKAKIDMGQRALVQFTNLNGSSVSFDLIKIVDGD